MTLLVNAYLILRRAGLTLVLAVVLVCIIGSLDADLLNGIVALATWAALFFIWPYLDRRLHRHHFFQPGRAAKLMGSKKSGKILGIGLVLILLASLPPNALVQATWASLRIRRGMNAAEALQVSGGWVWGDAHSDRPTPEPSVELPFNQRADQRQFVVFSKAGERQVFNSSEQVAEVLQQQMMGHPGRITFTYMGVVCRPLLVVFFDAQGKVQSVSVLPHFL